MSPQQHTLDKYAAQVNVAADQHGLPRQPLEYRDAPRISRAERQVKRSLSSVQPRAWSLSSYHYGHTPSQGLQECSGHGFSSNQAPSSSSPSLEAKRQRFQHIVPYSPPSSGSGSECMEGQHTPAPLPINELARQAALDSLNVMNNPPATALHDIAVCAASAFQVPVVVITLIGDTTVWCQVCIHLYLSICCVSCPPLTHSLTHSPARPPAHSLIHPPTHPPAHPPAHSLARSLALSLSLSYVQMHDCSFFSITAFCCASAIVRVIYTYAATLSTMRLQSALPMKSWQAPLGPCYYVWWNAARQCSTLLTSRPVSKQSAVLHSMLETSPASQQPQLSDLDAFSADTIWPDRTPKPLSVRWSLDSPDS